MMNTIRLAGDMCHVMSILVLLLRLRISKNAIGVSIKTQELYLIVFVTRYLDLFTTYYSLYNSFMKILYISATAYIIYMVKGTERFKSTYDKAHDSFLHYQFAVAPCVIFAVITNVIMGFNVMEVSLNSMSGKGFGDFLEVVKFYRTVLSPFLTSNTHVLVSFCGHSRYIWKQLRLFRSLSFCRDTGKLRIWQVRSTSSYLFCQLKLHVRIDTLISST